MNAKELHDAYVKYGLAAILGPDGVSPIVERALSLLVAVEGSGEEIVRELREEAVRQDSGLSGGETAELLDEAADRIVSDAQEKERLRAELASVKKHAEAMAWQIEDEEEKVGDEKWGSRIAYRRDFPKEGA